MTGTSFGAAFSFRFINSSELAEWWNADAEGLSNAIAEYLKVDDAEHASSLGKVAAKTAIIGFADSLAHAITLADLKRYSNSVAFVSGYLGAGGALPSDWVSVTLNELHSHTSDRYIDDYGFSYIHLVCALKANASLWLTLNAPLQARLISKLEMIRLDIKSNHPELGYLLVIFLPASDRS